MATTVNIPLTTLAPGSYSFPVTGGAAIPDTDSTITLNIDRTVTGGFNSVPVTTQAQVTTYQSDDGGATFYVRAQATFVGGVYSKDGNQINTANLITQLVPGTGRQVKATVVVSGGTVAVQGTLVTQ